MKILEPCIFYISCYDISNDNGEIKQILEKFYSRNKARRKNEGYFKIEFTLQKNKYFIYSNYKEHPNKKSIVIYLVVEIAKGEYGTTEWIDYLSHQWKKDYKNYEVIIQNIKKQLPLNPIFSYEIFNANGYRDYQTVEKFAYEYSKLIDRDIYNIKKIHDGVLIRFNVKKSDPFHIEDEGIYKTFHVELAYLQYTESYNQSSFGINSLVSNLMDLMLLENELNDVHKTSLDFSDELENLEKRVNEIGRETKSIIENPTKHDINSIESNLGDISNLFTQMTNLSEKIDDNLYKANMNWCRIQSIYLLWDEQPNEFMLSIIGRAKTERCKEVSEYLHEKINSLKTTNMSLIDLLKIRLDIMQNKQYDDSEKIMLNQNHAIIFLTSISFGVGLDTIYLSIFKDLNPTNMLLTSSTLGISSGAAMYLLLNSIVRYISGKNVKNKWFILLMIIAITSFLLFIFVHQMAIT